MKNPKLITKPFAQNGQKNAIPENYSSSMESNQATWDTGFGQITMIPVAAGGLPPKGQDFNGIFNQISENIVYLSKGGRFKFSADYAAAINGYPKGAILQSDDEKKEYQSIIDNNKVNFNTATQAQINAAWKLISTDDILQQIAGKQPVGNYALKGESYTKSESDTKFQHKGNYLPSGYSYSKSESDTKYQPKGNYVPAGDYATNPALKSGLDGKFDKSGGVVDGDVTAIALGASQKSTNSTVYLFPAPNDPDGYAYFQYRIGNNWFGRVEIPRPASSKKTRLMQVGDYGIGGEINAPEVPSVSNVTNLRAGFYHLYHTAEGMKELGITDFYGTAIVSKYDWNANTQILALHNYGADWLRIIRKGSASSQPEVCSVYTNKNTTTDRNGHLKVSGDAGLSDYPVGSPIPWPQATAPSGFLVCNGQSFNKATYPLLASAYPSGVLPDLRGEFIRGLDAGRNVDSARAVLSAQGDAIRNITGSMFFNEMIGGVPSKGAFYVSSNPVAPNTYRTGGSGYSPTVKFDASREVPTANENRPRNISFLYIVRAA